jgi:hypothetical protein
VKSIKLNNCGSFYILKNHEDLLDEIKEMFKEFGGCKKSK